MSPQLRDLIGCYVQAKFRFGLGENHPQFAPRRELALCTPQLTHLRAGISAHERIVIDGGFVHFLHSNLARLRELKNDHAEAQRSQSQYRNNLSELCATGFAIAPLHSTSALHSQWHTA